MATELATAYVSLIPSLKGAERSIAGSLTGGGVNRAADNAGKSMGRRILGGIGKVAAAAGGVAIALGIKNLGTAAIESASGIQNARETLGGLLGSAELATDTMNRLRGVARTSPIFYQSYLKAGESLAYMGYSGKETEGILRNVGAAITAAGGDDTAMQSATNAMLNMVNSGRVYAEQLNQISAAGVPIFSGLAAHFNTNIENVRAMVEEGKVSIDDVMAVMQNASGPTFQAMLDASDAASKTFSNQWLIAKDNIVTALGQFVVPMLDKLAPLMGRFAQAAPKMIEGAVGAIQSFATTTADVVQRGIGAMTSGFRDGAGAVKGSGLMAVLGSVGAVARGVWDALGESGRQLAPMLVQLVTALSPLGIVFRAIQPVLPQVAAALGMIAATLGSALLAVLPPVVQAATALSSALSQGLAEVIPELLPVVIGLVGAFVQILPAVIGLLPAVVQIASWLVRLASAALSNRVVLWTLVAAFLAWKAAVAGIALKGLIVSLTQSTVALARNTAAWVTARVAKMRDMAQTAALIAMYGAQRVAMIASAVATRGMAVAQRVLNVAMRMNPIGLVITALTALVAGLVYAWRNSETFRNIVTAAWNGIKSAASAVWNWLRGVFAAMRAALGVLGQFWTGRAQAMGGAWQRLQQTLGRVWNVVRTTVFAAFQRAAGVLRNVFSAITTAMGNAWRFLYNRALLPVWRFINRNIFTVFRSAIQLVRAVFSGNTDRMRGAFQLLSRNLHTIFVRITNAVFRPFRGAVAAVRDFFAARVQGIRNAWSSMRDSLIRVYHQVRDGAMNRFKGMMERVTGWVRSAKDRITDIWNKVRNAFARPINWVINTVWNNGLRKLVNRAADTIGLSFRLPEINEVPTYAKGGRHRGGPAIVGEEGPELVDLPPSYIHTAAQTRRMLSQGHDLSPSLSRRAAGSSPAEALAPMGGWIGDLLSAGARWVRGAVADMIGRALDPLRSLVSSTVGQWGDMGRIAGGTMNKFMNQFLGWVRGKDEAHQEAQAAAGGATHGGPPPGGRGGWMRPSRGPITSRFGQRWGRLHAGVDIAGGGPTFAPAAGTIFRTGSGILGGRTGLGIGISHGGGIFSYLGHNPVGGIRVRPGQEVSKGQRVGAQGATGNVTGVHVHYEHHRGGWGRAVNPIGRVMDSGGWVPPGRSVIDNRTGKPEALANVTNMIENDDRRGQRPIEQHFHGARDDLSLARMAAARVGDVARRDAARGVVL